MAGAGLITVAVLLLIGVLGLVFGLLRFGLQAMGIFVQPGHRLDPFELNQRRATGAAFIGTLCVYLSQTGGSLLGELPPWVPVALLVVAGLSVLLLFTGFVGARGAARDPSGVVVALAVAAGGYALLRWRWYLPTNYGAVSEFLDDWPVVAGFFNAAVRDLNELLPGIYIAVLIAALVRALICARLRGGAWRIIERLLRRRGMPMRPASPSAPASEFWAEMRASFERGRRS